MEEFTFSLFMWQLRLLEVVPHFDWGTVFDLTALIDGKVAITLKNMAFIDMLCDL